MNVLTSQAVLTSYKQHLALWEKCQKSELLIRALAIWLKQSRTEPHEVNAILSELSGKLGASRGYRDVAAAGYLIAAAPHVQGTASFRDGVLWLTERTAIIERTPTGIAVDGVALFGVALGAASISDDSLRTKVAEWLSSFLSISMKSPGIPEWQKLLMHEAGVRVGISVGQRPSSQPLDVFAAVAARDSNLVKLFNRAELVNFLRQGPEPELEPERLLLRLAAFDWVQQNGEEKTQDMKHSDSEKKRSAPPSELSSDRNFAWEMLSRAIAEVPAVKYFLGVVGLAAATSLVGALLLYNWKVAFLGCLVVFLGGILVVIFANLSRLGAPYLKWPALVLTWLTIILISATAICLFTSVFLGTPLDLRRWLDDKSAPTALDESPSLIR
jgi:hypothetical protein